MTRPAFVRERVPLAPLTTFEVGGPARWFARADTVDQLRVALAWARAEGLAVFVLGGGSNLVVSDGGFDGLVLQVASRGIERRGSEVRVAAGEPWDAFVAWTVERDLAGVECLSGIPGTTGATPVQNVGAYGQEVSQTIREVTLLDRATGALSTRAADACAFGYRDSVFKRADRDRFIVVDVLFELRPGGAPTLAYAELAKHCAARFPDGPSLAETRAAVIALRAAKSMVIRDDDENRRSAGSFFVNPLVDRAAADEVVRRWASTSPADVAVPSWPAGDRVKLSAGWLIERSGIAKGTTRGPVGVSTKHALAIVNRGGATSADVARLRDEIVAAVRATFGVELVQEPESVGPA